MADDRSAIGDRDLTSLDAWGPFSDSSAPLVQDFIEDVPVLRSQPDAKWCRAATRRVFATPATIHLGVDWLANRMAGNYHPMWGIHVAFIQDNGHGYYASWRHTGQFVAQQEYGNDYTTFSNNVHQWRPGGRRQQLTVTVGVDDPVVAVWDDRTDPPWGDPHGARRRVVASGRGHHKFPRIRSGRWGLRLDRQDVVVSSVVAQTPGGPT